MRRIKTFFSVFLLWTLLGMVSKAAFLLLYHTLLSDVPFDQQLLTLWHGLRLDIAIAGYLTVLPGVMLSITVWSKNRLLRWLWNGYFALTAFAAAVAYVANLGLYSYWGFPLDNTPLLYLRTSPADAMASLAWWHYVAVPLAIVVLTSIVIVAGKGFYSRDAMRYNGRKAIAQSVLLLVLTALLLLPIRGGIGTGTNHTGSVYYSDNIRLNHAAVNPIFSFLEAVLHQEEIGTKYRFMDDGEATALFETMTCTTLRRDALQHRDTLRQGETTLPTNVVLIVLESFSDTVMRIRGVTPCLQRLMRKGLYFDRFYANSFRTDRALVAIHSALPAQPTMSVMDMPRKSTSLPSIAGTLGKEGYQTTFYYGGDINYSNMRSYFMGTGFQRVVTDVDFPARLHTGKWGVSDGPVFDRMLADIKAAPVGRPFFSSIMTVSSHEPFDVPDYHRIKDQAALNAFAYTDHCLGAFVDSLRLLPCWQHTLVAIVPDHLGAWPDYADNYEPWRYHVPFIVTGGALQRHGTCHTIGSQIDIAATLLGMLGISHEAFTYSKDLLDGQAPHFAFFDFPDAMGMITDTGCIVYDNTDGRMHQSSGLEGDRLLLKAKAYLQKLYDDLDKR